MSEHETEPEQEDAGEGHLAVPGSESHEAEATLSPDERGTEDRPVPVPSEPKP